MKTLFIDYIEPFKAQIKRDIQENDIFFNQYKQAAGVLESLLAAQSNIFSVERENMLNKANSYGEYTNNIIAFCGDRGYGKTSMMLSFLEHVKSVSYDREKESCLFSKNSVVRKIIIADTIYIDPSTLENEYNILDILLSNMFKNVKDKLERNDCYVTLSKKNELIKIFQKVYRTVSIIKDSKTVLEKEFDDEGDLSKLSCLSESTRLKELFAELLKSYFLFMYNVDVINRHDKNVVIIAIDDLDISFSNAYKMAEQIRKYLIIPGIVILMAIRIPQLQCSIEEYNMRHFEMYMRLQDKGSSAFGEVKNLAYRYVSKLIPLAHRVLLSRIDDLKDIVVYDSEIKSDKQFDNPIDFMIGFLYQKTGIRPLYQLGPYSVAKVDNLRDFINMVVIIKSLEKPVEKNGKINDKVVLYNIENYFYTCFLSWLEQKHMMDTDDGLYGKVIGLANLNEKADFHNEINKILYVVQHNINKRNNPSMYGFQASEVYDNSLCFCMAEMDRLLWNRSISHEEKMLIEVVKLLYSIRLSYFWRQMRLDNSPKSLFLKFTNRLIWGLGIDNAMGYTTVKQQQISRMRFILKTNTAYNCIVKKLDLSNEFLLAEDSQYITKVPTFTSENDKKRYVLSLLFFGMLCNNFYSTEKGLVINSWAYYWGNSMRFNEFVQVSMENYILYMCILDDLPRLLRFDLLGIENEYSNMLIKILKKYNRCNIERFGVLICNPDHMTMMREYIYSRGNYDYTSFDDKKIINNFFEGMSEWLSNLDRDFRGEEDSADEDISIIRYGDGEFDVLDISEIYYECFVLAQNELKKSLQKPIDGFQELLDYLEARNIVPPYQVSKFMRQAGKRVTVKTMRKSLLYMAKDIGMYIHLYNDFDYLSNEWKDNIIRLFTALSSEHFYDENSPVPKDLLDEYNSLAEHFEFNWLRMRIDELKDKMKL